MSDLPKGEETEIFKSYGVTEKPKSEEALKNESTSEHKDYDLSDDYDLVKAELDVIKTDLIRYAQTTDPASGLSVVKKYEKVAKGDRRQTMLGVAYEYAKVANVAFEAVVPVIDHIITGSDYKDVMGDMTTDDILNHLGYVIKQSAVDETTEVLKDYGITEKPKSEEQLKNKAVEDKKDYDLSKTVDKKKTDMDSQKAIPVKKAEITPHMSVADAVNHAYNQGKNDEILDARLLSMFTDQKDIDLIEDAYGRGQMEGTQDQSMIDDLNPENPPTTEYEPTGLFANSKQQTKQASVPFVPSKGDLAPYSIHLYGPDASSAEIVENEDTVEWDALVSQFEGMDSEPVPLSFVLEVFDTEEKFDVSAYDWYGTIDDTQDENAFTDSLIFGIKKTKMAAVSSDAVTDIITANDIHSVLDAYLYFIDDRSTGDDYAAHVASELGKKFGGEDNMSKIRDVNDIRGFIQMVMVQSEEQRSADDEPNKAASLWNNIINKTAAPPMTRLRHMLPGGKDYEEKAVVQKEKKEEEEKGERQDDGMRTVPSTVITDRGDTKMVSLASKRNKT